MAKASPHLRVSPLVSLVVLALALRLLGLTWGLPNAEHWYSYHPDERQIAIAVSNVANDFNPHFFNYPSLFIYLTYFAYLAQNMLGLGTPANNTPWPPLHDVILSGRLVCALLGAFTIPAVYGIAKKLAEPGVRWPLLAAFLMAVTPGHVQHSHFATVDVPATFFVAWSLYFAAQAMSFNRCGDTDAKQKATRSLLFSTFFAGLAAATKYNAGLVALAPLCALWLGGFDKKFARSLGVIALTIFAFVLGCPFSVFSTKEFLGNHTDSGLLFELIDHPKIGQGELFQNTGNGWFYHLTFNIPFVLTAPLSIVAVIGLIVAARSKNKQWLPLLAFAGLYFLTLGLSQVRYMRYNLPLVPVFCLCAAFALAALPRPTKNLVASALALLVFIGATNVLYPFCVPDPRDRAAAPLKIGVTKPVTIALINRPWFYTPSLWPQDYPPGSGQTPDEGVSPDGRFRFVVKGIDDRYLIQPGQQDFDMANEFEYRENERLQKAKWDELPSTAQFKNRPPLELPGRDFVPHDFLYTNPKVWIYQHFK